MYENIRISANFVFVVLSLFFSSGKIFSSQSVTKHVHCTVYVAHIGGECSDDKTVMCACVDHTVRKRKQTCTLNKHKTMKGKCDILY